MSEGWAFESLLRQVSADGSRLAVAASYTWENGDVDHPADAIHVRRIGDTDFKPKPMKASKQAAQ